MILQATDTFRDNVRQEMQSHGITQRQLAKKAKTGYPNLNRVLQGRQNLSLDLADRIADALQKTLPELLERKSRRRAG